MAQEPNVSRASTDSPREEKLIRDRERLLDLVLAQFCDVMIAIDGEGTVLELRGSPQAILQQTAPPQRGQVLWDAAPELGESELRQKVESAMRTQQFERASGQLLPGTGWVEVSINPSEGGAELFFRDLSSFQQERDGRASAEKSRILFKALLDYIPEGILIADKADTAILVLSEYGANILGIPREDLLQKPFGRLLEQVQFYRDDGVTPVDEDGHPLTRALRLGERDDDEGMVMRNALNQVYHISCKFGPIRNEEGEIIAGIFSWMNMTERVQARQSLEDLARQLESSNKSLESFAYSASHDLQEPLRKIVGFSGLLQRNHAAGLGKEGQDLLERIRSAANRMQGMIDSLLSYSRLAARAPVFASVPLNRALQNVLADLDVRIQRTGARVQVDDLPSVRADPALVEHLFLNLLGNAVKFSRPGVPPVVRVYAVRGGAAGRDMVRIAVEDNGVGFEMQHAGRIFEPFQRLHGKQEYEGNGLGLAICKKIVDLHGGQISLDSRPEQGTVFWVDLPRGARDEA